MSSRSLSLTDFKQLALLGEGSFSAVYKVLRLADGEIYALKKVKLPSLSAKEKQNALTEVRLLASVEHENIISYKEAFFDEKTQCLCIITELANGGDLMQTIVRCQKERSHVPEEDAWRYFVGMCKGLKSLHDMRIVHRDLKSANVFLNGTDTQGVIAMLADFNVSTVAKQGLCMTQTGTPYYVSPEVWKDMPYDAKSDIWSLGCVLYEMLALKPPFRAKDMQGLYRKVVQGQYPPIPSHYSRDLSNVLAALLQVNARNRPTVDQILQAPVVLQHMTDDQKSQSPIAKNLDLLNTIKLPKKINELPGILPQSRYCSLPSLLPRASLASAGGISQASEDRGAVSDATASAHGAQRRRRKHRREARERRYNSAEPQRLASAEPPLPPATPSSPLNSCKPSLRSSTDHSRLPPIYAKG